MDGQLRVVCAWCDVELSAGTGEHVSHGICVACAKDFVARLPETYLAAIAGEDGAVTLFSGETVATIRGEPDADQLSEGIRGGGSAA